MTETSGQRIQFADLITPLARIREKVDHRIKTVLDRGQYILGPENAELEEELKTRAGRKFCISCSSGTDALLMALMAYGVGPGDTVITTPFTFFATAEVISILGATPLFVDIHPETFNLSTEVLSETLRRVKSEKRKVKGIIAVDLFGQPADYDRLEPLARENNLFLLEDAAQSFGASYRGKPAGAFGEISATSFFPAKPLGCYGDGGALFCDDADLANILSSIRQHGKGTDKYDNIRIGINGRLHTLQAAILLAKLDIFEEEIRSRKKIAQRYTQGLERPVRPPKVLTDCQSAWAQYSILTPHRNELVKHLATRKIPTAIYYPKPLHLQTAFSKLGYKVGDFPVAEEIATQILSLPMHPYLTEEQQSKIINETNDFHRKYGK